MTSDPNVEIEKGGGVPSPPPDTDFSTAWRSGGRLTTAIHTVFGGVAGVLLFVLMSVTMVDVVGRYVFNSPLPGGNEIVQILMAAIIYVALPSVCRQEAHITVDLLDAVTPTKVVPARQIITNLAAAVILGFISWCLWIKAKDLGETGGTFEFLGWPHAPFAYVMCFLAGIAALVFLANLFRYLLGAREPQPGFI